MFGMPCSGRGFVTIVKRYWLTCVWHCALTIVCGNVPSPLCAAMFGMPCSGRGNVTIHKKVCVFLHCLAFLDCVAWWNSVEIVKFHQKCEICFEPVSYKGSYRAAMWAVAVSKQTAFPIATSIGLQTIRSILVEWCFCMSWIFQNCQITPFCKSSQSCGFLWKKFFFCDLMEIVNFTQLDQSSLCGLSSSQQSTAILAFEMSYFHQ